jgi:hypothetical protein
MNCTQCGSVFVPRRERARFCCVRCRAAWIREHAGDPAAGASALLWSVGAMTETIERLPTVRVWDRHRALAAIGAAVWQVILVDATLVRRHPDAYDRVLALCVPAERALIERTMAGLRFVRNHIGDEASLARFIQPGALGPARAPITGWAWKPVQGPVLASLAPRGRAWELRRYQAYQEQLAGRSVGETFGEAAAFLELIAAHIPAVTATGAHVGR